MCNECGSEYSKWQGQCGDCKVWNSVVEFHIDPAGSACSTRGSSRGSGFTGALAEAQVLVDIDLDKVPRLTSGRSEFDRVLGGGMVPASAILIATGSIPRSLLRDKK